MWQELIITDVTRMGGDRVCIAGVDQQGVPKRPVLPSPGILQKDLYFPRQNVIRPSAVIHINLEPKHNCEPPHIEDYVWLNVKNSRFVWMLEKHDWKDVLKRTLFSSVSDLFGTPIHNNKNIQPKSGVRSLGTLKPQSVQGFDFQSVTRESGKRTEYRLSFTDASGQLFKNIPINDLALQAYIDDLFAEGFSKEFVTYRLLKLLQESEIWLRLGLTRPWEGWCWLQVTGIYTFPDYLNGACFADFSS